MKYEFKKLTVKAMALMLILGAVINGYFYYQQQQSRYAWSLANYDFYMAQLNILEENPDAVLEDTMDGTISEAKTQQDYLALYESFILDMPKRAEASARLSSSGENGFSKRNIEKTVRDFEGMESLPLKAGPDAAFNTVYHFPVSDILALVLILMVCVRLFSKEYERKLYPLILAAPSRLKTAVRKIVVLFLVTALMSMLLYGGNLLLGGYMFGFGDLGRPIQSISEFRTCSLRISCLEYLGLGFIMKLSIAFVSALFIFALFAMLKKAVTVFFVLACFLGLSFAAYSAIEVTSNLNSLHFVNIFHMSDSFNVISRYQNINIFGYPVTMTDVYPIVLTIVGVLSTAVICLRFYTGAVGREPGKIAVIARLADKIAYIADKLNGHGSIFLHELRKTMLGGRALIILIALAAVMIYNYDAAYRIKTGKDLAYESYIAEIGGKITEKTQEYIQKEWDYLAAVDDASLYGGRIEALGEIDSQVQIALMNEADFGIEPYLIDEKGFLKLFSDRKTEVYDSLFIIAAAALSCAGVFARENIFGTKKLLRICKAGTKTVYIKFAVILAVCTAASLIVNITRYMIVAKDYYLGYMETPVQSISSFMGYPYKLSIFQYMILLMLLRFLGAVAAGLIIAAVSSFSRSDAAAICLSLAALCAPVIAIGAGADILKYISVFAFTSGNLFLQDTVAAEVWYGVLFILCMILCPVLAVKQWKSGMNLKKNT